MQLVCQLTEPIQSITLFLTQKIKQKVMLTFQNNKLPDPTSWRLLRLLQQNARLPFRKLGEAIGLTAPAVAERVRRLEESGIIKGYFAEIDLERLGLPIMAFVHLTTDVHQSERFRKAVMDIPAIIECHCVTGHESYIMKVAVPSVPKLEALLFDLKLFGEMRTSLILSCQVSHRVIDENFLDLKI
jgi:Lrp/AsnC family transcriptional regulator, leucine-responsive regulatory protein